MKIHHLNCATFCPRGGRLVGGEGRLTAEVKLVCHCLLVETERGLVLVDSGLGTRDVTRPRERLGLPFLAMSLPRLDASETALSQIHKLGFARDDITHIVLTHLDLDHAGGLSDFPRAKVHLLQEEHGAAMRASFPERIRYRQAQWSHGPDWQLYSAHGERWFGFECVRKLTGLPPEILLVPLRGHTHGHTAVAISWSRGWLLHAGDAYFHHTEMQVPPSCPRALDWLQRAVEVDGVARRHNQQRLRDLAQERAGEVRVFCAHDASELERLQAEARARGSNGGARLPARADAG